MERIQELKEEERYSQDYNPGENGDLPEAEKELNALKGSSKGDGKGKFDGTCNHCGKYGHKIPQCLEKDKEMAAMKGKGGGKGGEKSSGKGQQGKGYPNSDYGN